MRTIGILSDTHINTTTTEFIAQISHAFSKCDTIIHAGDLTDISVLNELKPKQIFAVHGNMCSTLTQKSLPEQRTEIIDGYTISICHGANGPKYNIEERLFEQFPTSHCIVFGHTHEPLCQKFGATLMINPGSFKGTGRYGAPGTYAILEITDKGLKGAIRTLPLQL